MIITPFKRLNKTSQTAPCSQVTHSRSIDIWISYQFLLFFYVCSEIKISVKLIVVAADRVDRAAGTGEKASISSVKRSQAVHLTEGVSMCGCV